MWLVSIDPEEFSISKILPQTESMLRSLFKTNSVLH